MVRALGTLLAKENISSPTAGSAKPLEEHPLKRQSMT